MVKQQFEVDQENVSMDGVNYNRGHPGFAIYHREIRPGVAVSNRKIYLGNAANNRGLNPRRIKISVCGYEGINDERRRSVRVENYPEKLLRQRSLNEFHRAPIMVALALPKAYSLLPKKSRDRLSALNVIDPVILNFLPARLSGGDQDLNGQELAIQCIRMRINKNEREIVRMDNIPEKITDSKGQSGFLRTLGVVKMKN